MTSEREQLYMGVMNVGQNINYEQEHYNLAYLNLELLLVKVELAQH